MIELVLIVFAAIVVGRVLDINSSPWVKEAKERDRQERELKFQRERGLSYPLASWPRKD